MYKKHKKSERIAPFKEDPKEDFDFDFWGGRWKYHSEKRDVVSFVGEVCMEKYWNLYPDMCGV